MQVLVTGGTGMVGQSFTRIETSHDLILVGSKECDLRDFDKTKQLLDFYQPDAIIHLAAKVGGVKGNTDFVADFYRDNTLINTNILDIAHQNKINKVVSLLSTCIYPDNPIYPLTEEQIHNGEPHVSNFGYAYAKRGLDVHSRALRQQYGSNFICAVPNNIYGPCDNFDLENGHVIPAIIRKIWEAKKSGIVPTFWGDGRSLREFTFVNDIAKGLLFLLENYDGGLPINIGTTEEYSIKEIVRIISKELKYEGDVMWDVLKPSGQYKKPSDNSRFIQMGWNADLYTPFHQGISRTCEWFRASYPHIRGY